MRGLSSENQVHFIWNSWVRHPLFTEKKMLNPYCRDIAHGPGFPLDQNLVGGRTKIFLKIIQFLCRNGRCRLWGYFKSSEGCKKCVKMTNFLSSHAPYNCALHYFRSLWALRGPKMAPFSFYRPFKVHKNQKTRVHQKFGRCNCGWDEGLDQS